MYFFSMLTNRLLRRTARPTSRGGFTLVELLVVIGIIAILAGVALGPITNGIKQAQHNAALQTGRQIGQLCFAWSTDNNGVYPSDTTAVKIAQDLINANYASDPGLFGVSSQKTLNSTKPTVTGTAITLDKSNVSWCFTCVTLATSAGVTSSGTSDLIPLIYFNNGFGVSPTSPFPATAGTASHIGTYGTAAPFGNDGTAVFYKGNNAVYMKAGTGGVLGQVENFISANNQDTTTYVIAP